MENVAIIIDILDALPVDCSDGLRDRNGGASIACLNAMATITPRAGKGKGFQVTQSSIGHGS